MDTFNESLLIKSDTVGALKLDLFKYEGPEFYRISLRYGVNSPILYGFDHLIGAENFYAELMAAYAELLATKEA